MHRNSHTHFALLSVQVELMLANSHDPNSFDQRVTRIPSVDEEASLSKGALGYCSPEAKGSAVNCVSYFRFQIEVGHLIQTKEM